MPCLLAQDGRDRLGGTGQGDGVRQMGREPFVAGVVLECGGGKFDFAGEKFLERSERPGERRFHSSGLSKINGLARNSLASAASASGTCSRKPPAPIAVPR